jgi:1-acyl-sn-glycerol-3-phosphate acyltransferase
MPLREIEQTPADRDAPSALPPEHSCEPTRDELAGLSAMEHFAFRVVHRMNRGRWKRLWTLCQRTLGASWIHLATYNIMDVYGLEHVESISHERPLLLAANHRSFFDMYVVSSALFRRTRWRKQLFFPVRGRFFYESPLGMFVNFIMGWWSMYPPVFTVTEKRLFDKYSIRLLAELCRNGAGNVIGFHPEGHRNLGDDPYSYLRPQPGIGKLVKDAAPQVIPVFIAGLSNNLPEQVLRNWRNPIPIRIHFGAAIDFTEFLEKRDHVRTYKEIAEFVMSKIAELGEQDRALYAVETQPNKSIAQPTYREI